MTKRNDNLGRPAPNEDKDQNVEQLKAKGGHKARHPDLPPRAPHPQEAERVDPTGRTRAGDK